MTADLVAFLNAQLDEDEQVAKAAIGDHYSVSFGHSDWTVIEHIARWTSARVLADVQAKRAILGEHRHVPANPNVRIYPEKGEEPFGCRICADRDGGVFPLSWCTTLRLLAQPFADHPGFRKEWLVSAAAAREHDR